MKNPSGQRRSWVIVAAVGFLVAACEVDGPSDDEGGDGPSLPPCAAPTVSAKSGSGLYIYGGKEVASATHPFVGSLVSSTEEEDSTCTASLICPDVVLTAAHCFVEGPGGKQGTATSAYRFSLSEAIRHRLAGDERDPPSGLAVREYRMARGGFRHGRSQALARPGGASS